MNDQDSGAKSALNAYAQAVYTKDIEAFVAVYTPDAHTFDAWGQWELRGADALREMASGWFGSLGDERVIIEFGDLTLTANDDIAWAHTAVTFAAESASGERLRAMTNRATFCLTRQQGTWHIAHQHTSLPIDMATMTAIRER